MKPKSGPGKSLLNLPSIIVTKNLFLWVIGRKQSFVPYRMYVLFPSSKNTRYALHIYTVNLSFLLLLLITSHNFTRQEKNREHELLISFGWHVFAQSRQASWRGHTSHWDRSNRWRQQRGKEDSAKQATDFQRKTNNLKVLSKANGVRGPGGVDTSVHIFWSWRIGNDGLVNFLDGLGIVWTASFVGGTVITKASWRFGDLVNGLILRAVRLSMLVVETFSRKSSPRSCRQIRTRSNCIWRVEETMIKNVWG